VLALIFSINLSSILAPVLNNHLIIKQTLLTIASINWGNISIIIQVTICSINWIYVAAAQVNSSLTVTDGDSNWIPIQLEGISNTHRDTPREGCSGHLWYNSGIMGLTDAVSSRATLCQVIGTVTPWCYANVPKHILTSSRMRTWPLDFWPELYYSDLRLEWLIRPTKC
jgi:hypothetical protein